MDGVERETDADKMSRQTKRDRHSMKRAQNKVQTNSLGNTHTPAHREQREGHERINGCALIDKLIKQTKTSAHIHIKTQNIKQRQTQIIQTSKRH